MVAYSLPCTCRTSPLCVYLTLCTISYVWPDDKFQPNLEAFSPNRLARKLRRWWLLMKPYYDGAVVADDIQCWVAPAQSLKVAVIAVLLCVWPVALFITLHAYLVQLLWNNYQEHVSLLRSVCSI
jgi:hypothetical protein